ARMRHAGSCAAPGRPPPRLGLGAWRRHGPLLMIEFDLLLLYRGNGWSRNSPSLSVVHLSVTHLDWTDRAKVCDPAEVSVTDPMLVVRRHVDLLRVRSAIC